MTRDMENDKARLRNALKQVNDENNNLREKLAMVGERGI